MAKTGGKKSRRDAGVELARLLACLAVLGVHSLFGPTWDGDYRYSRVLMSCFYADGVAVFWMITGCFLFSSRYGKALKNALTRILIPLVLISLAGFALSFLPIPGFAPQDPSVLTGSLLHWRNEISGMEHLWYLYVNLFLVLIFPLLKFCVDWLDQKPVRGMWFLGATLLLFVINGLFSNKLLNFNHGFLDGWLPAAVEMIWGHLLYKRRKLFSGWVPAVCLSVFWLVLNLIRAAIQYQIDLVDPTNTAILYWFSPMGLLCAACTLLFGFCVFPHSRPSRFEVKEGFSQWIVTLSSYSFLIYLVHFPIIRILNGLGLSGKISDFIFASGTNFALELLDSLIMIVLLFTISFVVSWLIRQFWILIKKLYASIMPARKSKQA